jgi:hypothetical protein
MNLVGRAGAAGDELGSSLIGSRLVGDLTRLAFLMERQYAPYSTWFGTAFSRLGCGSELTPILRDVGRAADWRDREAALMTAYERLAEMHDALGLTAPVKTKVVRMWDRPFTVARADIPDLLLPVIQDQAVLSIAQRWPVGPGGPVPRADLDTEEPTAAVADLRPWRPTDQRPGRAGAQGRTPGRRRCGSPWSGRRRAATSRADRPPSRRR